MEEFILTKDTVFCKCPFCHHKQEVKKEGMPIYVEFMSGKNRRTKTVQCNGCGREYQTLLGPDGKAITMGFSMKVEQTKL